MDDPLVGSAWPGPWSIVTAGRSESMDRAKGAEAGEMLAATSVAVAVNACGPSARLGVVNCQPPAGPTEKVPNAVGPSDTVSTVPGSAVPGRGGVGALVSPSPGTPGSSVKPGIARGAGGRGSTTTGMGRLAAGTLP